MYEMELSLNQGRNKVQMTHDGLDRAEKQHKQCGFKSNRYNQMINMEKQLQYASNSDSEVGQISAPLIQDNLWAFKSFSLEESNSFQPKQCLSVYEINDINSQISQAQPFYNPYSFPQLNWQLDVVTPKTEEGQSFPLQQEQRQQSLQNLESFYLQGGNQQTDYQASYHRGHIQFLRQLKTPIFMQSRKYCKSKRKMQRGKTYYKFIARHMRGYVSNSCKRFDQYHLQQTFKNMDNREQEKNQATLQALRHLKKHRLNSENKRLLDKHEQKYSANRKWGLFLGAFINNQK